MVRATKDKRWEGALVKIVRDIKTQKGTVFRAGVRFRVEEVERCGLSLTTYVRGNACGVRCVDRRDVVVLEWAPQPEPEEPGSKEED